MNEENNINTNEINNTTVNNENINTQPNDILMDNNQPETQTQVDESFENQEPKKKGIKIWIILLLILIIATVGGIAYYIILGLNSKNLTLNGINKMLDEYKTIVEPLDIKSNINMDKIQMNNKFTFELNGELGEIKNIINGTDINTKVSYDKQNKKMLTSLDLKIDNVNQQADVYVNNKEGYALIKDIYDKYIKIDDIGYDLFQASLTKEDINHITKITKESIIKNLDESLFTKKINFPNAQTELNITKQQMVSILNNVKKDLLNDAKVKELLETFNISEEDKNKQITEEDIDFDNITIKVNQSILKSQLNNIEIITNQSTNTNKVIFTKENNIAKLAVYNNDKEEGNINLTKVNKNFTLDIKSIEDETESITITGTEDNGYYTYKLSYPENKIELTNRFKISSGSSITYDGSVELKYQDYDIKVNYNGSISPLTTDINIDTSNAIKAEEISDEELEQIETKLYQKFSPVINKFSSALGYNDYDM